jgi:peptide/nickel transport system substrate-binding protein
MNVNAAPLDDARVRQAISMAIPYDAIIENLIYGYGSQPTSPLPAGMEGHTDEYWTYGDASMEDAIALLADAGYPDGFDIELAINQSEQTVVDTATWIQAGLSEIGINLTINAVPAGEYIGLLNSHELPLFIHEWYSWGNDPFYQLSFLLKCGQFTNYANYCNEEVDDIIAQGVFSRDSDERAELARRAQEIIVTEAPWAYLFSPDQIIVTRSNVSGITVYDDQMVRFAYLTKE